MNKKLTKKIEKQLDKLSPLLDQIEEARILNADDPETWNSDTLYNLAENLKEALQLLEDQKTQQRDEFGQPLTIEGLCSLMDDYETTQEEEDDD